MGSSSIHPRTFGVGRKRHKIVASRGMARLPASVGPGQSINSHPRWGPCEPPRYGVRHAVSIPETAHPRNEAS